MPALWMQVGEGTDAGLGGGLRERRQWEGQPTRRPGQVEGSRPLEQAVRPTLWTPAGTAAPGGDGGRTRAPPPTHPSALPGIGVHDQRQENAQALRA